VVVWFQTSSLEKVDLKPSLHPPQSLWANQAMALGQTISLGFCPIATIH